MSGAKLVTGGFDKRVIVWRLKDMKTLMSVSTPSKVCNVAFARESDFVIVCCKRISLILCSDGSEQLQYTPHTKRTYGLSVWEPITVLTPTDD